jgi:excisionase family DNA binding protein
MTAEEVAALLRVNRKAIYGAVARGELPGAHRVGRKLRFARDAVLAWLVGRGAVAEAR